MRLPTDKQINRILDLWKKRGLEIGGVDVTANGVSVRAPGETAPDATAYDEWKNQSNDRSSRH